MAKFICNISITTLAIFIRQCQRHHCQRNCVSQSCDENWLSCDEGRLPKLWSKHCKKTLPSYCAKKSKRYYSYSIIWSSNHDSEGSHLSVNYHLLIAFKSFILSTESHLQCSAVSTKNISVNGPNGTIAFFTYQNNVLPHLAGGSNQSVA